MTVYVLSWHHSDMDTMVFSSFEKAYQWQSLLELRYLRLIKLLRQIKMITDILCGILSIRAAEKMIMMMKHIGMK